MDNTNTKLNTSLQSSVGSNWIKVNDGKFECSECGYTNAPETNTSEGVVTADLNEVKNRLESNPNSSLSIYGICPTCAMEYTFRLHNGELYLEPSDMQK